MSRPRNTDQILLALKARLLQFDREYGIIRGVTPGSFEATPVITLLEDLKAIFYLNVKMVAPFYTAAIKQLEDEMTYIAPSRFDKLAKDANTRSGSDEPEVSKRARELAKERLNGIFRCVRCGKILDIESTSVTWNKLAEGYEHVMDCSPTDTDARNS